MLTLDDLITSSGKYLDRANSDELTDEVKANGEALLKKVNALLEELEITDVKVSSGFRPSAVNATIKNAAKKSLHQICRAIDLEDADGKIDEAIKNKPEVLTKFSLWLEHPDDTKGWSHLDDSDTRKDRPVRIFKP